MDDQDNSAYPPLGTIFAALLSILFAHSVISRMLRSWKVPWNVVPGWMPIFGHYLYIGSTQNMGDVPEVWAEKYSGDLGCYEMNAMGKTTWLSVAKIGHLKFSNKGPSRSHAAWTFEPVPIRVVPRECFQLRARHFVKRKRLSLRFSIAITCTIIWMIPSRRWYKDWNRNGNMSHLHYHVVAL